MVAAYNIHTGEYIFVNNAVQKLLGYTPEEFLQGGLPFVSSLVHPDDLQQITEKNTEALKRANEGFDEIQQFEYRMRHKDGSWRWLHTDGSVLSRKQDGSVEVVLNVSLDITVRREIEAALLATEEERQNLLAELQARVSTLEQEPSVLEAIVHSSEDAIVSKSLEGIIRSWNTGAEKIFGYFAEEAIGKHISLIIPKERLNEETLIVTRIKKGERVEHYETQRRTKSGDLIDVSLSVSPVKDRSGNIIGASKIARNISDRKRHEALLREEEQRKDEFLAVLAHELRNPLAPISSAADLLQMKDISQEDSKWAVEIIQRQLTHMTRIVDDLLDLSRITRNKFELKKKKIDLGEVLKVAGETSKPLIAEGGHTLTLDYAMETLYVEGDLVRLAQVVSNLLSNAAKYTPKGGHIFLSAKREGNEAVVEVRDNGIGISRDMLTNIFEMFVQGRHSLHASRGLGIGLTLVKRLLEMHSGSIHVQSAGEGQGSTFTMRLPLLPTPQPKGERRLKSVSVSPLRILVVDDNKDALAMLSTVLRLQGNLVEVAEDGLQALKTAQLFKPDVVLLDIGMPNMNGYEAAKAIRSQPWGAAMTLIALTGWGQASDKERAFEAGFNHHVTKPVDSARLSELLAGAA